MFKALQLMIVLLAIVFVSGPIAGEFSEASAKRRRSKLRKKTRKRHKRVVHKRHRKQRDRLPEIPGHRYKVMAGDTLTHIARRFKVKVKDIQRWNKMKGHRIYIGRTLRIHSPFAGRRMRKMVYRVERGDRLHEIAKRFRISVRHLRWMNRRQLRRRRWRLRVGMRLKFYIIGPKKLSASVGLPHRGSLINGERLPSLQGVYMKNGKQWGTNETISYILSAVWKFRKRVRLTSRRIPLVVIGDLSRKEGKRYSGHRSHQSGRDADIGYISKRNPNLKRFKVMSCRTMDVPKTWTLLNAFLETGKVERIFINYYLQRCLHDYLRKRGVSKRKLAYIMQYPRGRGSMRGVLRHFRNHHHHFHIRFGCSRQDKKCRDNGERRRLLSVNLTPNRHRRKRTRRN